ncbi:PilZ domain-containing protein [Sphingomonas sp.]|uniref:PilZ domain-containing protein n=1 Tax=Sphingomonas sp. TaxID=28214 RepID=UPI003AFFA1B3
MRLAATLTPGRGALRRAIRLAATMRGQDDGAVDVTILDISTTGFLAELPADLGLAVGVRVRVAVARLGPHAAVVVRQAGRRHGFAFLQPLPHAMVAALDPDASNVEPLFPTPSMAVGPSPRTSLLLAGSAGAGAWTILALLLYLTA